MSLFEDSFGAAAGLSLTDPSYVPTLLAGGAGSGSWQTVQGGFVVSSNANHARCSNTGENRLLCSANPGSTAYDVECDWFIASDEGSGGLSWQLLSHADSSSHAYAAVLSWSAGGNYLSLAKNGSGGSGTLIGFLFASNLSVSGTYHVKLTTRQNSVNPAHIDLAVYLTRASDGYYATVSASSIIWQAGATAALTITDDGSSYGNVLATGTGGIYAFDNAGEGIGTQFANFRVTPFSVTLSSSPSYAMASTSGVTIQLSGTNTNWIPGTPGSPTFTLSAGTITSQVVASANSATIVISTPASGPVTITDPSTGASATLTINNLATGLTFTGPNQGAIGAPSSNFTITPVGGLYSGTVTPSDGGGGGTFSPSSLTWSASSASQSFTYTPTSVGAKTVALSANPAITIAPASLSFTATNPSWVEFLGDSWTYGIGSTQLNYPSLVLDALGAHWSGENRGQSGWKVSDLSGDLANWATSRFSAARSLNVACVLIGINDVGNGATAAQLYSNLQSYCEAIKAAQPGWKIVVFTLPSCYYYYLSLELDSVFLTFNALLRANYSFADALADLGSDPHLGPTATPPYNSQSTIWYSPTAQGLHPADTGYTAVAAWCLAAIAQLQPALSTPSPAPTPSESYAHTRIWIANDDGTVRSALSKTVGDSLYLAMDFGDIPDLIDGQQIESCAIVPVSGLTIGTPTILAGYMASALFEGGVSNTSYEIVFNVTLTEGITISRTALLNVI